jgi:hypothetical protein
MVTESATNSSNQQLRINRDNLQDINEVNDQTPSVVYTLTHVVIQQANRVEDVEIRRPKVKHHKKIALLKESEQPAKLIECTTDIPTHLIDELDLSDFMNIQGIILRMMGKYQAI